MQLLRQFAHARAKKHIALFLAFFVLISNAGLAMHVHYCDDQIASVSLNTGSPSNAEKSCCGSIEKKSPCCKDKVVLIQKKADQALVKTFSFEVQDIVFAPQSIPAFRDVNIPSEKNTLAAYYCDSHAPPLFKLYSQYIFYDEV